MKYKWRLIPSLILCMTVKQYEMDVERGWLSGGGRDQLACSSDLHFHLVMFPGVQVFGFGTFLFKKLTFVPARVFQRFFFRFSSQKCMEKCAPCIALNADILANYVSILTIPNP